MSVLPAAIGHIGFQLQTDITVMQDDVPSMREFECLPSMHEVNCHVPDLCRHIAMVSATNLAWVGIVLFRKEDQPDVSLASAG